MSERERDIFDDLDALKVGRPDVERAPIKAIAKPARLLRAEPFGMIPLASAKRIGGLTNVVTHLDLERRQAGAGDDHANGLQGL
jgi:hypothetical protein